MAQGDKFAILGLTLSVLLLFLPQPSHALSLRYVPPEQQHGARPQGETTVLPPGFQSHFFREVEDIVPCGSKAFLYHRWYRTRVGNDNDTLFYYNPVLRIDMRVAKNSELLSAPPPGNIQCSADGERVVFATNSKERHAHWILFDARRRKSYELTTDLPVVLSPTGSALVFWKQGQIGGFGGPPLTPSVSRAARGLLDFYDLEPIKHASLSLDGPTLSIYPDWLDRTHFGFVASAKYLPTLRHNALVIFNTNAQAAETFSDSDGQDWVKLTDQMLHDRFPGRGCTVERDSWSCFGYSPLYRGRGTLPKFDYVMAGPTFTVLMRERFRGILDYKSVNISLSVCSQRIYIVSSQSPLIREVDFTTQKFQGVCPHG